MTGAHCHRRGWESLCFLLCHQVPRKPAAAGVASTWTRTCDKTCAALTHAERLFVGTRMSGRAVYPHIESIYRTVESHFQKQNG